MGKKRITGHYNRVLCNFNKLHCAVTDVADDDGVQSDSDSGMGYWLESMWKKTCSDLAFSIWFRLVLLLYPLDQLK